MEQKEIMDTVERGNCWGNCNLIWGLDRQWVQNYRWPGRESGSQSDNKIEQIVATEACVLKFGKRFFN